MVVSSPLPPDPLFSAHPSQPPTSLAVLPSYFPAPLSSLAVDAVPSEGLEGLEGPEGPEDPSSVVPLHTAVAEPSEVHGGTPLREACPDVVAEEDTGQDTVRRGLAEDLFLEDWRLVEPQKSHQEDHVVRTRHLSKKRA